MRKPSRCGSTSGAPGSTPPQRASSPPSAASWKKGARHARPWDALRGEVFAAGVTQMRAQLEALLDGNFPATPEQPWFNQLARYLKGIGRRAIRMNTNLERDTALAARIRPFECAVPQLKRPRGAARRGPRPAAAALDARGVPCLTACAGTAHAGADIRKTPAGADRARPCIRRQSVSRRTCHPPWQRSKLAQTPARRRE